MKTPKIKLNYLIISLFAAILFSLSACEKSPEVITPNDEETADLSSLDLKINVAVDEATAANSFDEVTEITDEAMDLFDSYFSQANGMQMGGSGGGMGGSGGGMGGSGSGMGGNEMINDSTFIGANGMGTSSLRNGTRTDTLIAHGNHMRRLSDCVIMTRELNESNDTVTMIIDYGEGCEGLDGKIRSGRIIIIRTGRMYWDGTTQSEVTFDNYIIDGKQVSGTKTKIGFINDAGNRQHNIVVVGQIILAENAGTISWNANRTREVVVGSDTRFKLDDVIHVTGSSSGVTADGSVFTSEIIEPLVRIHEEGCYRFYVAGITHITRGADTEITINYGDGTCDNLAEITTNGITETVELNDRRGRGI